MLFVIDVGNTNTVLGLYQGSELIRHWRISTNQRRTADEYAVLLRQLFMMAEIDTDDINGTIISCVVPPLQPLMRKMAQTWFKGPCLVVGPGTKTGMAILYENPREVGADRIVSAVAAYERFQSACIVLDFGTATTFDAINSKGEYMGGAIAPGIAIASEALFQRASKLPRVEVQRPDAVIGRNTVSSIQSGLVFGYLSLIEGMLERIQKEYGQPMKVIATGGLAGLFASLTDQIDAHDDELTLDGLRIIYERNVRA